MITQLQLQGFKSWHNTGPIKMAQLTGFFGTNSSGKTAILQSLLMFKQTVESADRSRVLHTGDDRTYVDLGTIYDIIHGHHFPGAITFAVKWTPTVPLIIPDPEQEKPRPLFRISELGFDAAIEHSGIGDRIYVREFAYNFNQDEASYRFGMKLKDESADDERGGYELADEGYSLKRSRGRPGSLPNPVKCYGFPDQVNVAYQNAGFLTDLVLAFEQLFQGLYYLGPLREYPHRTYAWGGDQPQDVGQRGELAVPALLAARSRGQQVKKGTRRKTSVDERVAQWLRELGLIHSFSLRPIAENRKEYEVRVRRSSSASEVAITDVGFGVSQILPVLVLCYYAPEGSTILLEQPEIHLHPSVQAGLADVFIDAIKTRKVQILLESHSEHLLRRLQRRIAEDVLPPGQTALYFVSINNGASQLEQLQLDLFGNITNWPDRFFGDEMGELVAMTEAAMRRQAETG